MLASTTHTILNGWGVVCGVAAALVAIVMDKLVPQIPWLGLLTLFAVVLFGVALTVHFG